MKTIIKTGIAISAIGIVGAVGWKLSNRVQPKRQIVAINPDMRLEEIAKSPKSFIAANESSKDPKVQNLVTRARITAAYDSAKKKDFPGARAEFIEASYKHQGTDAMDPSFGTLSDQAAYQAIVCLDAEGKKTEAQAEYRKFIKEHKLSPLIHACARRLERLNNNVLSPNDQALLESGIAAQEEKIRFETSVCGPKCLAKILPSLGAPARDYKELASLCGRTDKGTTMEGLKKGCETLGLHPVGLELNNRDFSSLKKPFIWIQSDHYLAVLEIKNGKAHFYDPRFNFDDWRDLPKNDDPAFRAQVLAFEVPNADLISDYAKPKPSSINNPSAGGVPTK
jgi:hypothetical protein